MKKKSGLSALFGISQKDMAQLLNVHRSQWAMFETGKRDLPAEAKLLLTEMLAHMGSRQVVKKFPELVKEQAKRKNFLLRELHENERKRLLVTNCLNLERKKYQANVNVLRLTAFLSTQMREKITVSHGMLQSLSSRASANIEQKGLTAMLQYEIKLELLQLERQSLEELLKKYSSNPKE